MSVDNILAKYSAGEISTSELLSSLTPFAATPLSESQKGLWAIQKISADNSGYNVPLCVKLQQCHLSELKAALLTLVRQFPVLNSQIEERGEGPFLVAGEAAPDITETSMADLTPEEMLNLLKQHASRPFDLRSEPLLRLDLFINGDDVYLLIVMHHIIADSQSSTLVINHLLHFYHDLVNRREPELNYHITPYSDYVAAEKVALTRASYAADRDFWQEKLDKITPLDNLPQKKDRQPLAAPAGKLIAFSLPEALSAEITHYCAANRATPASFFLTAFAVLLFRYSGQTDITPGVPFSTRDGEQYDHTVGHFINMLPVRIQLDGNHSFTTALQQVSDAVFQAIEHGTFPFSHMVRSFKGESRHSAEPVFSVTFNYQNSALSQGIKSVVAEFNQHFPCALIDEIYQTGEYPLGLDITPENRFIIKYDENVYATAFAERMAGHYKKLIESLLASPTEAISRVDYLPDDEKTLILHEWNNTKRKIPQHKSLYDLFSEQAKNNAGKCALLFNGEKVTYRELNKRVIALACHLQKKGIAPGDRVGICTERSTDMVVALLGVLCSGATYVPLDPSHPQDRVAYVLNDAECRVIISQRRLEHQMDNYFSYEVERIYIDDVDFKSSGNKKLKHIVQPCAYILYTSGSTGNPKGVMIRQRAVINTLLSVQEWVNFTEENTLLALTTYCFDISAIELFMPLISGGCCIIADDATTRDAAKLVDTVADLKPDFVPGTPATFTMMFKSHWENREKVKIICAGEPIANYLKAQFDKYACEVWNYYGPTETTIYSTGKKLVAGSAVNIGKPIANTTVYILDENRNPVAPGMSGELYIGGEGVAAGYWKRDDLTREKFLDNPFAEGEKLYRTGDIARWLDNGDIDLIGRADNQIKIRGYRVELGEVESRLSQHPDIENSVVLCLQHDGAATLAAFYIAHHAAPTVQSLREHLRQHLPAWMIPDSYHQMVDFPLTPNGKIDRKKIAQHQPASPFALAQRVADNKDRSDLADRLHALFAEILGYASFSRQATFFDIGGDSFKAIELISRFNTLFNLSEKVTLIFQYPSVNALEQHLQNRYPALAAISKAESAPAAPRTPAPAEEQHAAQNNFSGCYAIVGISCQVPGAKDHRQFWENLCAGKESIELLTSEQLRQYGVTEEMMADPNFIAQRATIADKDKFDAGFFHLSPRDAELMDPQARLLLQHSWLAVEDAGYNPHEIANTAVYASASNNFYQALWPQFASNMTQQRLLQDAEEYNAWIFSQGGTIPTLISHKLGFTGPSMFINTNCSSSLSSSYLACQSLAAGDCDFALVGAATLFAANTLGYVYQPGLNFSADGHCKAFDDNADGMVGGEGVAAVLLRRAEDALRDGDNIYAIIRSVAVNNDGADKVGFYAPGVNGQRNAIQQAIHKARINPQHIRFVEAHGTGTRLGDPIEIAALTAAWRPYTAATQYCAIGSVKTNIGHLDTAAGLTGLIKAALALKHNVLPPSINVQTENRDIDFSRSPFYVATRKEQLEATAGQPLLAAISAFGIGGSNAHAILQQAESAPQPLSRDVAGEHVFVLSAQNDERLKQAAEQLADFLTSQPPAALADMAWTLQCGRKAMACRLAIVASDINGLKNALADYLADRSTGQSFLSGRASIPGDGVLGLFMSDEDIQRRLLQWKQAGHTRKLAQAWVEGVAVDWSRLSAGERHQRVSLPGYAFAKQRCWIEMEAAPPTALPAGNTLTPTPVAAASAPLSAPAASAQAAAQTPPLALAPHAVQEIIRSQLCSLLKLDPAQYDDDISFSDYGLNSLSAVKLIAQINAAMDLDIDVTRIFDYPTVTRLAQYIVQTCAPVAAQRAEEFAPVLPAASPRAEEIPPARSAAEQPRAQPASTPVQEPVAVIGMAGRFPQSDDIESFWQHIANGDDLVETVTRWDLSAINVQCDQGSFINDIGGFDPLFFNISGIEALNMEPQQRIFLEVAWHALEDAGQAGAKLNTGRCGVYVGCAAGDYLNLNSDQAYPAQALWGNMNSVVPARVSYFLNLKGPAIAIDTACSSSLVAIDTACKALWNGDVDVALAGGIYVQCSPRLYQAGSNAGMLSPAGRCKTFDDSADGFVPAEGAAALVLKKLSQAQADGDRIYGVIRGVGVNQDGASNGISAPSANAQYELLQDIYQKYAINVEDIQLVEAHGTGTKLGDPIEYQALLKAFSEKTARTGYCALGSSKSNMGHAQMAAGVIAMVKVLMAMKYRQLPPTLHCQQTNSKIALEGSPFYINKTLRPWNVAAGERRCAVVSSFGVGGTNAHVVLEDVEAHVSAPASHLPQCLLVSARSHEQLRQQVTQLRDYLALHNSLSLRDVAYTLWAGRKHFTKRAFLVADSLTAAIDVMNDWLARTDEAPVPAAFSAYAQDYLQGKTIDLSAHFAGASAHHVSLPLYPFTHEQYWLGGENSALFYSAAAASQAERGLPQLKPVAGHAGPEATCYTMTLTGREFFLQDHQVQGNTILPGSVYFEIARLAFAASCAGATDSLAVQDVTFLAPLALHGDAVTVMVTLSTSGEKRRSFEICTVAGESNVIHCRGEIAAAAAQADPVDIDAIRQNCQPGWDDRGRFYREFAELGINYGPSFRGIVRAYQQPGAALVQLSLPKNLHATLPHYLLHPALADCAMQSMKCLVAPGEAEQSQLLFAISDLALMRPCEAEMWVWIRYACNKNGEFIRTKYDADLLTSQGNVCARFRGITTRVIAAPVKAADYPPVCLLPAYERLRLTANDSEAGSADKLLFLGGDSALLQRMASDCGGAQYHVLAAGESGDNIAAVISALDEFTHLVWISPAASAVTGGDNMIEQQRSGIYQVFNIHKALLSCGYGKRQFSWTVILQDVHDAATGDVISPVHAGISGFVGSLAKETPDWRLRCVDVDNLNAQTLAAVFALPPDRLGNTQLLRHGEWYQQTLIPLIGGLERAASGSHLRQSGVVVIAGGAGGLGSALSEALIRQFDAQVIWLGRRALNERIQQKIMQQAKWGKAPHYVQVDVQDPAALKAAHESIVAQFGPVNGLIQSAMVLQPAMLDKMTSQQFAATYRAKMDVSVRLVEAFESSSLQLVLFLSTINSYMKAMGQSNYSAGCTFKDAFSRYLSQARHYQAKVINLGYCFNNIEDEEGNVDADQIVHFITRDEFQQSLVDFIGSDHRQMSVMKFSPKWSTLGMLFAKENFMHASQVLPSFINTLASPATHFDVARHDAEVINALDAQNSLIIADQEDVFK